jgi:hypothetical protein
MIKWDGVRITTLWSELDIVDALEQNLTELRAIR